MRWESEGTGEFTIEMVDRPSRGTEITLHLKADQDDLLSAWKLKSIIRKYSDHIVQPIVMKGEKWDDEKKQQVATDEDETVSQASALWARPKSEITDEQYQEFYKHVGHDFEDPLTWTHSLDTAIRDAVPNPLAELRKSAPALRRICFNGRMAARRIREVEALGFEVLVLPSTSPAHAGKSIDEKLARWRGALQFAPAAGDSRHCNDGP